MNNKKKFKVNDVAYLVDHSVYGNPKTKLNEPYIVDVVVLDDNAKNKDGQYHVSGVNVYATYFSNGDNLFHTREEAQTYINEHKDEIIAESFRKHQQWYNNIIKRIRTWKN